MENFNNKIKQIIPFLKSIDNKAYIFSRFISVSIKPLILFICLTFGFKEFVTVVAMVFLVIGFATRHNDSKMYSFLPSGISAHSRSE